MKQTEEIVAHIQAARTARRDAKTLLARAKLVVETAIEHGEAEGMKLLAQP